MKHTNAPVALDVGFYRAYHADLHHLDDDALRDHFIRFGRIEGRAPNADALIAAAEQESGTLPDDFDEAGYLALYPDVQRQYSFARGGALHFLKYGRAEGRSPGGQKLYDESLLHLMTNRIHDLPDVVVSSDAPQRINVLVPAFDFRTMSAGFFGVFQVARFIARCGFAVRLVMFDNFYWNEAEFRERLRDFPGMERLFDELEVDYIGARDRPLLVSPGDNCVATVWYSAYFADKIMARIGGRPFLYLIQDYETQFFPGGALFALADESYQLNFHALFSSLPLQESFLQREIGIFAGSGPNHMHFNNACASNLPARESFLAARNGRRRLAFYSRPNVNRNMFELGALALCKACRLGILDAADWEFVGVGIGDIRIRLADGVELRQMRRMTLREYQEAISSFDLGLCLMASPHPSLLPFDLAGSGALVVTNSFGAKTPEYFARISDNIIATRPTLDAVVAGLRQAAHRVPDRAARWDAAASMQYPTRWADSFAAEHIDFIRGVFRDTARNDLPQLAPAR